MRSFIQLLSASALVLSSAICLVVPLQGQSPSTTPGTTGGVPDPGARPAPRDTASPVPSTMLSQTPQPRLLPVFFPPTAPVLDSELPAAPGVRDPIWTDLIPDTNELFYAPLGSRLASGDLNRRLRQRLDAYHATRTDALAQLRAALDADPGRPAALAQVAQSSEPQLANLATTADELRRDLYRGAFLTADADWNQHRNWRLGAASSRRSPQEMLLDEYSVMRAAIFYQEGLSIDQRQLLREVVVGLAETLGERDAIPVGERFEPEEMLFFLPHGSRLKVPAEIPADLAAALHAFTDLKNTLKRELRDALFELDQAGSSKRERALQTLALQQAPRFAELAPMAERIREQLAALPASPLHVARPFQLPPALAHRVEAYLREKADLQRAASRESQPPSSVNGRKAKAPTAKANRAALADFEEKNRARFVALATEARAIREEVARVAAAPAEAPARSVDALLADFASAFRHQQLRALYRDYRTAVLVPGLTPAQRQLLFNAAVAALDQPGVKDWQAVPE